MIQRDESGVPSWRGASLRDLLPSLEGPQVAAAAGEAAEPPAVESSGAAGVVASGSSESVESSGAAGVVASGSSESVESSGAAGVVASGSS
ncbi:MAG: hypothetical protein AAGF02_08310, partial [Actinomycetota bacterium]